MSSNNNINNHSLPSATPSSSLSTAAIPITTSAFASALASLPLSSLHAKVAELRNSLAHLRSSNAQLQQAVLDTPARDHDENSSSRRNNGNDDAVVYTEAITENRELIGRLRVRIILLKREVVDVRGMEWVYGDEDEDEDDSNGHSQSEEVVVAAAAVDRTAWSEERELLVNGERTGPEDRRGESTPRNTVAANGVIGEHESRGSRLGQSEDQPNRRLTHEELQERLRERLGNQQGDETEGVFL